MFFSDYREFYISSFFNQITTTPGSLFSRIFSIDLQLTLEDRLSGLSITSTSPLLLLKPSNVKKLKSLNESQRVAAKTSLLNKEMINLIAGPPGSGKTTVISSIVDVSTDTFVITAQSNAAAKNLAGKE